MKTNYQPETEQMLALEKWAAEEEYKEDGSQRGNNCRYIGGLAYKVRHLLSEIEDELSKIDRS